MDIKLLCHRLSGRLALEAKLRRYKIEAELIKQIEEALERYNTNVSEVSALSVESAKSAETAKQQVSDLLAELLSEIEGKSDETGTPK